MKEKRICSVCGQEFTPRKSTQKYCSIVCGRKQSSERAKKYFPCQHCGKLFWRPNAFRMKYCSPECQREAHAIAHPAKEKAPKVIYQRECAWCGSPFSTPYPNKKYCSEDCCYKGNLKGKREQWAEQYVPKTYVCKECGTEFTTECGNTHSVFCSPHCATVNERHREHETERHKRAEKERKKRRDKMIRSCVEVVLYDDLFQRDSGCCQICGLPVHSEKGVDDYWDGTIDHIVPLSKGGEHSMSNCQLAHRVCNSLKCQCSDEYKIDWTEKSKENNYWQMRFNQYTRLMLTDQ